MTKKIINTFLLSLCCIKALSATPLLASKSRALKKDSILTQTISTDVNFSGVWKSDACIDEQPMTISILQDNQDYIRINNGEICVIGALQTGMASSSIPRANAPEAESYSFDWNTNKTELILRGISVKEPSEEAQDNSLNLMIQYSTLALNKKGQLLLKTKALSFRDLELIDELNLPACVFDNVSNISKDEMLNTPSSLLLIPKKYY